MAKKFLFLIAVLAGCFFIFFQSRALAEIGDCATSTGWGNVKINELSTFTTNSDWVELYNNNAFCVSLNGLAIWDSNLTMATDDMSGEIINPFGWLWVDAGNRFNSGADEIFLHNNVASSTEDSFAYGPSPKYAPASTGQFYVRFPDGTGDWQITASATPGYKNEIIAEDFDDSTTTPTTTSEIFEAALWSQLRLNEIFPAPDDGGDEWVEIFNPATSSVDLSGGHICDSTDSGCKPAGGMVGVIDPESWLVVNWVTSYLNNTGGDSVYLKNPAGEVVDQISYDNSANLDKHYAYARNLDGSGEWQTTITPTPSSSNIISAPPAPSTGGGGSNNAPGETTKTTIAASTTKKTAATTAKAKEIGLIWKIKHDTRSRVGEQILFDASESLDPRGGRISFLWDMGVAEKISGDKIFYTFTSSGIHNITVFATSSAGTMDSSKIKIMIYPSDWLAGAGVIISEVLPNTTGTLGEFISIKNISSSTINISNWKLMVEEKIYPIPTGTFIMASDTLIFYRAFTNLVLNNNGGEIELRADNDLLVDKIEYGKAKANVVFDFNGASTTIIAPTNTVNIKNPKIVSKASSLAPNYVGQTMDIAQIRELAKDAWIKARGVVTAVPAIFGTQFFYIADDSGGMQVYQYKKDFPPLAVGDSVEVVGQVSEASGVKRIKLKNAQAVDILSVGNAPPPVAKSLVELGDEDVGSLVKVSGQITEIKSYYMYVDDGEGEAMVYFKKGAQIDKSKFKEGDRAEVVGVYELAKAGAQIWPRAQGDISVLTTSSVPMATGNENKKYAYATGGGFFVLVLGWLARARGALLLAGARKVAGLAGKIFRG